MCVVTIGQREVDLSNTDKVLFPGVELTKGDLIEYYERVAPYLLPHVADRPLVMQRAPDGLSGQAFYHKDVPDHFPGWIRRIELPKRDGTVTHVLCEKPADLVYLANQACITLHTFLSRADEPHRPDRLVIDLDPADDGCFDLVRSAARSLRDTLAGYGLAARPLATGSRGLHVVAPLHRGPDFDDVRGFARAVVRRLAAERPRELTIEHRKAKRARRVFLDVARNAYAQTAVAPYTVRLRPGAPVAVPLDWDELGPDLKPDRYSVRNVFRRLAQKEDPWPGDSDDAGDLPDETDWPASEAAREP